jgi:hypothetical protein
MIYYPSIELPTPDLDDYNSNSYITGILNFVGVNGEADMLQLQEDGINAFVPGTPIGLPGWDKPVPSDTFASRGCQ